MSIVFALERTNQLSLLPNKDLVDLCHPIEPYQVTKNLTDYCLLFTGRLRRAFGNTEKSFPTPHSNA
ncbi:MULTISPECIES: hypothetical protein [unclassified Microcystis]|uniref:hypothetical protein n=1 Tax=unclassified Microcystis TaxID=2643300 RepID=UPI002590A21F|nr:MULTISPECIES: hypothetical protein [unclassified Microcystis]MCA2736218.1 hypothetical protein [Microcystis sp. M158S2]MCA2938241.1 hypothetical protein [Microcystis sp. M113S1]